MQPACQPFLSRKIHKNQLLKNKERHQSGRILHDAAHAVVRIARFGRHLEQVGIHAALVMISRAIYKAIAAQASVVRASGWKRARQCSFYRQKLKIIATNVPSHTSKQIIGIRGLQASIGHWLAREGQNPSELTMQLARFFPH
ncbi:hypothetical protein [Pseudomonas sp. TWI929]|uniref:hypothetical protein n=1 Tax=Pseudomonas sp. TWI929 TaxID=3136795 RepID=UPI0032097450